MAGDLSFDFITDEQFRAALVADADEMSTCASQRAWKAVHVLAGSIVEALLVDELLAEGGSSGDPLKMSLGQLIDASAKAGIISGKTVELSGALKSYRNLIHPGRAMRLADEPDEDGAIVAQALVSIIVHEIAARRFKEHGLTAEQIVRKVETDPSAMTITRHLLGEARGFELSRLLLTVIPDRYFAELDDPFGSPTLLDRLAKLYRAVFDAADGDVKAAATRRYLTVLREESGEVVRAYEERFFRADDLDHVAPSERGLAKDHLLARLKDDPNEAVIEAADGLGAFLRTSDVSAFVDPLVRLAVAKSDEPIGVLARERLEAEGLHTKADVDDEVLKRLDSWIELYDERGRDDAVSIVTDLRSKFNAWIDIPF